MYIYKHLNAANSFNNNKKAKSKLTKKAKMDIFLANDEMSGPTKWPPATAAAIGASILCLR